MLLLPPPRIELLDERELRALIVATARSYKGVRYRHQGRRDEGRGLDCLGVLLALAQDLSFGFVDDRTYRVDPDGYYLVEKLREHMDELPCWRAAGAGDVVVQRYHVTRPPQHIGIVVENSADSLRCVHASRHARAVTENYWPDLNLITHAFRIRELSPLVNHG